jgi:hypothetical protein
VGNTVEKVALGQVSPPVFRFTPVSIIPLVLHTHLRLYVALTGRSKGRTREPSKNQLSLGNWGTFGGEIRSFSFFRVLR